MPPLFLNIYYRTGRKNNIRLKSKPPDSTSFLPLFRTVDSSMPLSQPRQKNHVQNQTNKAKLQKQKRYMYPHIMQAFIHLIKGGYQKFKAGIIAVSQAKTYGRLYSPMENMNKDIPYSRNSVQIPLTTISGLLRNFFPNSLWKKKSPPVFRIQGYRKYGN